MGLLAPPPAVGDKYRCHCGSEVIVVVAFRSGWRVSCHVGHEVFPWPETAIRARIEPVPR